jgi:hypothetical protein
MEIIKIIHKRYSCGFGKPEQLQFDGARFPNGKIAYMDDDETVCAVDKEKELQKALVDVKIEVQDD